MKLKELLLERCETGDEAGMQLMFGGPVEFDEVHTKKLHPAARALLAKMELKGDDWKPLDKGYHYQAYGNKDYVLKVKRRVGVESYTGAGLDAPEDVAAKVHDHGMCNGVHYVLLERLQQKEKPLPAEMVPLLFRARDQGFIYTDMKPENLGQDKSGKLKVLDHEHFLKVAELSPQAAKDRFAEGVIMALEGQNKRFPLVTWDEKNTYVVVFNVPSSAATVNIKRLQTTLAGVGLGGDTVEVVEMPPVVRVKQVKVEYGTPPASEKISVLLSKALKEDMTPPGETGGRSSSKGKPR